MYRAFRYPLHPTKAQEVVLNDYLYRCQQLYNGALEHRISHYKRFGKSKDNPSLYSQYKNLVEIRTDSGYGKVPNMILRSALKRLDLAYQYFFRRIKSKANSSGFPRFRSINRYDSFDFLRPPSIKDSRVNIPRLGYVKFNQYRPIKGILKDATVRKDSLGKWWVTFKCDLGIEPKKVISSVNPIGIDLGLSSFITSSNGEKINNPKYFTKSAAQLADRQRSLSRKSRGSRSRKTAKKLVAKTNLHIKNQRLDFVRKLVVSLFSRYDLITYEDLQIQKMISGSQKKGSINLSKSIHDASWGIFIHALNCKAEEAGKLAVSVNPRGTTSTCSGCSFVIPKKLHERIHECPLCGLILDRDHNAAINVLRLGLSQVNP